MAYPTRAYFVLVTARKCDHCHTFKMNYRAPLLTAIQSVSGVSVVEIEVEQAGIPTDAEMRGYHPQLRSKIEWFPTFFIFNNTWTDYRYNLEGVVFNGKFDKSAQVSLLPRGQLNSINHVNIVIWVNAQLAETPLFGHFGSSPAGTPSPTGTPSSIGSVASPGYLGMSPLVPLPPPSSLSNSLPRTNSPVHYGSGGPVYDVQNGPSTSVYRGQHVVFGAPIVEDVNWAGARSW